MRKSLIIVDLQNDYFPGENMELFGIEKAAGNARLLLNKFRNDNLPVFHIQHISIRPGSTFFLPDTSGAEINERISPKHDETVIVKHYPNSFRETSLLAELQKLAVRDLVICGAMSHMCIDSTTRAAFDLGFNCIVAEDACATKDQVFGGKKIKATEVHASFMAALSAPFAEVSSTESVLEGV